MQVCQLIDVITTHSLCLKHTGLFAVGDFYLITLNHENAGGIVWNQRIQRVHHEIQYFLKVKRLADFPCDIEQHAQLVCSGQARQRRLFDFFSHRFKRQSSCGEIGKRMHDYKRSRWKAGNSVWTARKTARFTAKRKVPLDRAATSE